MSNDDPIAAHIRSLNEAWQSGNLDDVAGFYHPDVILLPPDAGEPIVGRAAVVDSYRQFADAATLYEFQITSLDVFPFAGTAISHMRFDIEYAIDRGRFRESGLEVYVTTPDPGAADRPQIVWRSQAVLDMVEILPARPASE